MRQIQLNRALFDLRHLPVTRAHRSFGSMVHFHFGELYDEPSGSRTYRWGQYYLMIELADWEMRQHNRLLATSDTDRKKIDRVIALFLGARVKSTHFSLSYTAIQFDKGFTFAMWPDPNLFGPWDLSNWTLFQRGDVVVESVYGGHRLR